MPVRWVINPVVIVENVDDDTGKLNGMTYRAAKVSTLIDPGTGEHYAESSAIDDWIEWCVSRVRGSDFSPMDEDGEMKMLLEYADDDEALDKTLKTAGMDAAKVADMKADIEVKGADAQYITEDSKVVNVLDTLLAQIAPHFNARETKA